MGISIAIFGSISFPLWLIYLGWESLTALYSYGLSSGVLGPHIDNALGYVGLTRPPSIPQPDPLWIAHATVWLFLPLALSILMINAFIPMSRRIRSAFGYVPRRLESDSPLVLFVQRTLRHKGDPKVTIWLIADKRINAFALSGPLGGNAIVLSAGILEQCPPAVVRWVIAHEYGHIVHHDTRSTALWLVSLRTVAKLNWLKVIFSNMVLRAVHRIPLIRLLTTPLLLVLGFVSFSGRVGIKIGTRIFLLFDRWASRRMEYAADRFAAKTCGAGPGILLFSSLSGGFESRFNSVFATHPTHLSRIGALEKLERGADNDEKPRAS